MRAVTPLLLTLPQQGACTVQSVGAGKGGSLRNVVALFALTKGRRERPRERSCWRKASHNTTPDVLSVAVVGSGKEKGAAGRPIALGRHRMMPNPASLQTPTSQITRRRLCFLSFSLSLFLSLSLSCELLPCWLAACLPACLPRTLAKRALSRAGCLTDSLSA